MVLFHLSKFVRQDIRAILKHFRGKMFGISILIGFLLFLLNIFLGVSLYAHNFSGELKDKLGMYFYIKETSDQEDATYKKIILMKDELESKGLKVMYSSKDDALSFLQKKIPNVVDNFQKFGIDNPLPATLYVMFSTDNQYTTLKSVILKNKDIILNTQDVDSASTIKQQENRILTIINLSNFIITTSYCIIALILIVVLSFLTFLLRNIFGTLHKEFEVKKLLGASHLDVTKSFVMVTLDVIIIAFLICFALLFLSGIILNFYLNALFGISILELFNNIFIVIIALIAQLLLVGGISIFLAYTFTHSMEKKLQA
ncbi:MAG: hypothetical protein WC875_04480 [Candidatus Absconditabacterales bacterium]